jgi:hypothetical protein
MNFGGDPPGPGWHSTVGHVQSSIVYEGGGTRLGGEVMRLLHKLRFSMGTIMMFVLMAAAAMALFVKVRHYTDLALVGTAAAAGWRIDVPSLFLLAIGLTALALGSWKEHSAVQIMLQVTLACVGCLTLIWIGEAKYERAIRYWCQGMFAATVTIPMLARRFIKTGLPRGRRRDWWKKTCEAVFFSFLTMILVTAGGLLQAAVYGLASNLPSVSAGATSSTTTPTPAAPTLPPSVAPSLPPGAPPPSPSLPGPLD